ncbi:MAG: outer membrane lipoprotein-sorting protein [Candidatus Eiseniibacteriota bacterium]|nr:MAG: outer membrane lipoprotein-sorting protein [Candidatus Eisenbacteria bacterium]
MVPTSGRCRSRYRRARPVFGVTATVILVTLLWTTGAHPRALAASEETPKPPSLEKAPDVKYLLRKFDETYESSGTFARLEITTVRPRKTRTMRVRTWAKGEDMALIVIDAPARDAGTATLRVGRNLWNYLPKIARTIRVPPSLMMGSWMGSDLTNDDLVRESSYEEDYTSQLVGVSSDPPGWKVRLDAKPDVAGLWESVEIVFSPETELPVQIQYFDRKGRLSRTMRLEGVKKFGRRLIPTLFTIVPEQEEGRSTELRYLHVEFDLRLDDSIFSLSQLERKR